MSTSIMVNGSKGNKRSQYGGRRNHLTSIWDLLLGDQPTEWIGFKPKLGDYVYPCYACRHMFSSLSSLQDHVNRRIIILKYNCGSCCSTDLTFYNRCALLLHARNHFTAEEGQINVSEISTFTLPLHLAGFLPLPYVPTIYEEEEAVMRENGYFNVQFYAPSISDRGKAKMILKPNNFVYKENNQTLVLKQVCRNVPRCQFITLEEQKRLREMSSPVNEVDEENADVKVELFDYIDQLTLPVISKVESLHEKTFCVPRCLDCNMVQGRSMAEHYQNNNKPSDFNLTCPICKFVASSMCSYKAHVRIHNNEAPHVCPDCGKDFENSDKLHKHLNEVCFHLAKHVKFSCPGKRCRKIFASNVNLAVHFKNHFQTVYTCKTCGDMFCDNAGVEKHALVHKELPFSRHFVCSICVNMDPLDVNEFNEHLEFHIASNRSGVYVYMCRYCRNYFRSTATFATHLLRCNSRQYAETGNFGNCESCIAKNYCESKKSMGYCWKGNQPPPKKVPVTKKYFCILCNEQIQLEKKLTHLKNCKYARPVVAVHKLSDSLMENLPISPFNDDMNVDTKRRASDSPKSDESAKKKRKKTISNLNKNKRHEIEPDPIAEEPMEFDGTYYCKLCDYQNKIRSEFHSHIRTHRNISTAYQCMECGECFVVKPSLNKHLVHFHNISDHESYLNENDCYDVEAVKELETIMRLAPGESKGPVKENQCRVCLEEFENATALGKHFRVHGMAFLLKNTK